jgi:hydroxymethylpyrimidine pyrophosphatase-like HAD family hydrolase
MTTSKSLMYATNKMQILVFDYDGTLTMDDGLIPLGTQRALRNIYEKQLALLGIVSGRDVSFLKQVNAIVGGVFSFLVAENGAVFYYSGEDELVVKGRDWSQKARFVFSDVDFHIRFFEVIASSQRENAGKITEILKMSDLDSKLVLNKDSIMVCPPGVDKGSGVAEAIEHYAKVSETFVVCFGDGENDVALFGPADLRIAVSNAVEELKAIADVVTKKKGGAGVEEYLRQTYSL